MLSSFLRFSLLWGFLHFWGHLHFSCLSIKVMMHTVWNTSLPVIKWWQPTATSTLMPMILIYSFKCLCTLFKVYSEAVRVIPTWAHTQIYQYAGGLSQGDFFFLFHLTQSWEGLEILWMGGGANLAPLRNHCLSDIRYYSFVAIDELSIDLFKACMQKI